MPSLWFSRQLQLTLGHKLADQSKITPRRFASIKHGLINQINNIFYSMNQTDGAASINAELVKNLSRMKKKDLIERERKGNLQAGHFESKPMLMKQSETNPNILKFSYNIGIVRVQYIEYGHSDSFGTGFYIGNNTILSAAHCLFENEEIYNQWNNQDHNINYNNIQKKKILVWFYYLPIKYHLQELNFDQSEEANKQKFLKYKNKIKILKIDISPDYFIPRDQKKQYNNDWAILRFDNDDDKGEQLNTRMSTSFKLFCPETDVFYKGYCFVAGYHMCKKDMDKPFYSQGQVMIKEGVISHLCSTTQVTSGGPIFIQSTQSDQNQFIIFGIHTGTSSNSINTGTLINNELIQQLKKKTSNHNRIQDLLEEQYFLSKQHFMVLKNTQDLKDNIIKKESSQKGSFLRDIIKEYGTLLMYKIYPNQIMTYQNFIYSNKKTVFDFELINLSTCPPIFQSLDQNILNQLKQARFKSIRLLKEFLIPFLDQIGQLSQALDKLFEDISLVQKTSQYYYETELQNALTERFQWLQLKLTCCDDNFDPNWVFQRLSWFLFQIYEQNSKYEERPSQIQVDLQMTPEQMADKQRIRKTLKIQTFRKAVFEKCISPKIIEKCLEYELLFFDRLFQSHLKLKKYIISFGALPQQQYQLNNQYEKQNQAPSKIRAPPELYKKNSIQFKKQNSQERYKLKFLEKSKENDFFYNNIGMLHVKSFSTAFLLSKNLALCSGHAFDNYESGKVTITFYLPDNEKKIRNVVAKFSAYQTKKENDWAFLLLDNDEEQPSSQYLKLILMKDDLIKKKTLIAYNQIIGFMDSSTNQQSLYWSDGYIDLFRSVEVGERRIKHKLQTIFRNSGSPVIIYPESKLDSPYVLGVHTFGYYSKDNCLNQSSLIDSNELQYLIKQFKYFEFIDPRLPNQQKIREQLTKQILRIINQQNYSKLQSINFSSNCQQLQIQLIARQYKDKIDQFLMDFLRLLVQLRKINIMIPELSHQNILVSTSNIEIVQLSQAFLQEHKHKIHQKQSKQQSKSNNQKTFDIFVNIVQYYSSKDKLKGGKINEIIDFLMKFQKSDNKLEGMTQKWSVYFKNLILEKDILSLYKYLTFFFQTDVYPLREITDSEELDSNMGYSFIQDLYKKRKQVPESLTWKIFISQMKQQADFLFHLAIIADKFTTQNIRPELGKIMTQFYKSNEVGKEITKEVQKESEQLDFRICQLQRYRKLNKKNSEIGLYEFLKDLIAKNRRLPPQLQQASLRTNVDCYYKFLKTQLKCETTLSTQHWRNYLQTNYKNVQTLDLLVRQNQEYQILDKIMFALYVKNYATHFESLQNPPIISQEITQQMDSNNQQKQNGIVGSLLFKPLNPQGPPLFVCRIQMKIMKESRFYSGSGFFLSPTIIMTAKHVLFKQDFDFEYCQLIYDEKVQIAMKDLRKITVLSPNQNIDIALLDLKKLQNVQHKTRQLSYLAESLFHKRKFKWKVIKDIQQLEQKKQYFCSIYGYTAHNYNYADRKLNKSRSIGVHEEKYFQKLFSSQQRDTIYQSNGLFYLQMHKDQSFIYHTCSSTPRQSGSPMVAKVRDRPNQWFLLGVHTAGKLFRNQFEGLKFMMDYLTDQEEEQTLRCFEIVCVEDYLQTLQRRHFSKALIVQLINKVCKLTEHHLTILSPTEFIQTSQHQYQFRIPQLQHTPDAHPTQSTNWEYMFKYLQQAVSKDPKASHEKIFRHIRPLLNRQPQTHQYYKAVKQIYHSSKGDTTIFNVFQTKPRQIQLIDKCWSAIQDRAIRYSLLICSNLDRSTSESQKSKKETSMSLNKQIKYFFQQYRQQLQKYHERIEQSMQFPQLDRDLKKQLFETRRQLQNFDKSNCKIKNKEIMIKLKHFIISRYQQNISILSPYYPDKLISIQIENSAVYCFFIQTAQLYERIMPNSQKDRDHQRRHSENFKKKQQDTQKGVQSQDEQFCWDSIFSFCIFEKQKKKPNPQPKSK